MKVKKISKLMLVVMVFTIGFIMIRQNGVEAALQSNGEMPQVYSLNDWLLKIREMQSAGGTLGLTDTIDTTTLTSGNRNLDIHMEKNTEYGAMVILSASSYGNPNKIGNGETTTGNKTGVVMNINAERVSAGCAELTTENFKNANKRYKNIYTIDINSVKIGDAILDWHGSTDKGWFSSSYLPSGAGLIRSTAGSVFSYNAHGSSKYTYEASPQKPQESRAAIVVGSEL